MKTKLILISALFFSLLLLIQNEARATHGMGMDLTYQCVGGNTYVFQLAFYRDCGGNTAPASVSVNFRSASCNRNFNRTLAFFSAQETSPICASLVTECNGGPYPGAEEYLYKATVTLPAQCADWIASYSLCCRNTDINTIDDPGNASIYTETMLNNMPGIGCNSSPSFSNDPVPFVCANTGYCFNNGASDPDGDSLAYKLVTPKTGQNAGDTVEFLAGFSATNPMTSSPPLTLDPVTGDLCMNPTDSMETSVLAVLVEEYRNGVKIGSIRRDIQLRILTCPGDNVSPVLTGMDSTSVFNRKVCAGTPITFQVYSSDTNSMQIVSMNWNNAIPTASFNVSASNRPVGTFSWTPSMGEIRASPYCFTVTVRDNNCPFNATQTYSYCLAVTGITSLVDSIREPSCNGYCDGVGAVRIVNGTPPFTYQWNDPASQTTALAPGLCTGIYNVVGTDSVGCVTNTNVPITEPAPLNTFSVVASNYNGQDISCANASDGMAAAVGTGGTPPYTFQWDAAAGSQATDTAFNLAAGTYTYIMTDSNGCDTNGTIDLSDPVPLTGNTQVISDYNGRMISCNGASDGMLRATASGGTGAYSFQWDANAGNQSNDTAFNLGAGTYAVIITDANGCDTTYLDSLQEPSPIVTNTSVVSDYNGENISCFGFNDGSAMITASGATPPYTYLWNAAAASQTSDTAFNLTAGTFFVTVTDTNGCSGLDSVALTQPTAIRASISAQNNLLCNNDSSGNLLAAGTGGTGAYQFSWNTTPVQGGAFISNLAAGSYTVTVTDDNGCADDTTAMVTQPAVLRGNMTNASNYNGRVISCHGENDGRARVVPSGGTPPYTYLWDANAGNQTNDTAFNLSAGTYSLVVTDSNGCDTTLGITITQPAPVIGNVNAISNYNGRRISCANASDGILRVLSTGGTQPYSYLWDANAFNQTNDTATGLPAGTYGVTVTDVNGCDTVLNGSLTAPPPVTSNTFEASDYNGSPISCSGLSDGNVGVTAGGGTTPYTYLWDPATGGQTNDTAYAIGMGTYSVIVTDVNGCEDTAFITISEPTPVLASIVSQSNLLCNGDGSGSVQAAASGGIGTHQFSWNTVPVQNGASVSNLAAGSYTVTVTDLNGCTDDTTAALTEPAVLAGAINITSNYNGRHISCRGENDGIAAVLPTGGTLPYTYDWGSNAGNQTTDTAFNLAAGNYALLLTDSNGCDTVLDIVITEPPVLNVITQVTSDYNGRMISCTNSNDGMLTAIANGGTLPYSYQWSPNAFNQVNDTAFGLPAGTYGVTVTDANGCDTTLTDTLVAPPQVTAATFAASNYNGSPISCFGLTDGNVGVTPGGGTAPYTYLWDPATGGQANDTAFNLGMGSYSVIVTDINGCQRTGYITIFEPAPVHASIASKKDVFCNGQTTGEAVASATGGITPYQFTWNTVPSTNGAVATNLGFGSYIVTIEDANGCSDDTTVLIDQTTVMTANATGIDLICHEGSDGKAYATPNGGTPPYSYVWTTAVGTQNGDTARNLMIGWHYVQVIDAKNCTATDSVLLDQPDPVLISISANDTICSGAMATISANASGGTGSQHRYVWNNGLGNQPSHTVNPTVTTVYVVQGEDSLGCRSTGEAITVFIRDFAKDSLTVGTTGPVCQGDTSTVFANHIANFDNYTYVWTPAISGSDVGPEPVWPDSTTMYTLTIYDQCGNTLSDSVLVEIYPNPVIDLPDTIAAGCAPLAVDFTDTLNAGLGYTYNWNFGDGGTSIDPNPSHVYKDAGKYNIGLSVTSGFGCTTSAQAAAVVDVYVTPMADFTASPLTASMKDPEIDFTNATLFGTEYRWSFGDSATSTLENPSHTYQDSGTYRVWLIATNGNGCYDSTQLLVRIDPYFEIKIPNAFTPNPFRPSGGNYDPNAMNNDVFFPHTDGVEKYHMMIWNRWGELIFESFDHSIGWDGYYKGEMAQQEVYVWEINIKWVNGQEFKKVGDLTLFR